MRFQQSSQLDVTLALLIFSEKKEHRISLQLRDPVKKVVLTNAEQLLLGQLVINKND